MNKKNYERRLFISLLMTFIAILIIPTVTTVFLAINSMKTISDEIIKANETSFENAVNDIDDIFSSIIDITIKNANSSALRTYLLDETRNIMTEYQLSQNISTTIMGYNYIHSAYVYSPNKNIVVTSRISSGVDDFFPNTYGDNFKKVIDTIENVRGLSFVNMPHTINSTNNTYAFIRKIYPQDITNQTSVIVEISEKSLSSILKSSLWIKDSNLTIYNSNQIVASTTNTESATFITNKISQSQDNNKTLKKLNIDEINHTLSYKTSTLLGLTYAYSVPTQSVESSTLFTSRYITIIIPFTLAIAFLICWIFAKQNYSQLRKLLLIFQKDHNIVPKPTKSGVYEFIENSILSYTDKNLVLSKQLTTQTNQIQEMFLEKLLIGKIKYFDNILESCKMYNINFVGDYFSLVRFDIDEGCAIFGDESISDIEQSKLVKFVLLNISHDLFSNSLSAYLIYMDDHYIGIINSTQSNNYGEIDNITKAICDFLYKELKLNCHVSSINKYVDISDIPSAYNDICNNIESTTNTEFENYSDLINKCINIIKSQYGDNNLSVSHIADLLSLNPSYLSRFFKQQVGICLLDYLHKYRITLAKEMLLNNTDLSIKTIVEKTGFYNTAALIRVFKKHEGITPGQFKQSLVQK